MQWQDFESAKIKGQVEQKAHRLLKDCREGTGEVAPLELTRPDCPKPARIAPGTKRQRLFL